jgi:NADH-quinone oxidoreductase subunit A
MPPAGDERHARSIVLAGLEIPIPSSTPISSYWPLALYAVCVVGLVVVMIGLSYLLGQRAARRHAEPYESGIVSAGSAHLRISAKFYLLAMFFVIFDLEVVFIVAWAIAARQLGWPGYWEALIFAGVLAVALVYLWRLGALDWGTTAYLRRQRAAQRRAGGDGDGA